MIGISPRDLRAFAAALLTCLAVTGCGGAGADGPRTLTLWRHQGTDAENRVFTAQVRDFNASQQRVRVAVRTISEGDYNDELQAAAAGHQLPDVAEVDGPLVASYWYQHELRPLTGIIPADTLDQQLPSLQAQGTVAGERYTVGVFDSGLGLYADRRALRAAGIRSWPTTASEAWSSETFGRVLARLADHDPDGKVLDLKLNYGVGEWLTYGFSPLVASAGGSIIDPGSYRADGHLDGSATRAALSDLASWSSYVDPNPKDDAFTTRRVALSWVGHWVYPDYAAALGQDLVVLPLPDLGHGSKSGQGSWSWGVTRSAAHPQDAAAFLRFLLRPEQVLRMADANGAVPGNQVALARSSLYGADGPLRIFAQNLLATCGTAAPSRDCVAVPRPVTPAYPMLSAQFASAVHASLTGGDWEAALRTGTARVDRDVAANQGYR